MTPLQPTAELRALLRERADQFASVPADPDSARQQLLRIEQEELLAVMVQSHHAHHAGIDALHRTAHTLAYDAARKAVEAVLLAMGVRISRSGGHHSTVAAAETVLPPPPPSRRRNALSFARARNVRHEDEYPRQPTHATVTLRERREQTHQLRPPRQRLPRTPRTRPCRRPGTHRPAAEQVDTTDSAAPPLRRRPITTTNGVPATRSGTSRQTPTTSSAVVRRIRPGTGCPRPGSAQPSAPPQPHIAVLAPPRQPPRNPQRRPRRGR